MRLLHSLAKIHATFDDPNLVSRAGLVPVMARAQCAGLGDLAEDIDRLKREPGGVILAHGGATFIDALIHDGLIDEYRLVIHPVAIGHGTGLFSALREPLRLDLIEARRFPGGTAIHVYRPGEGNQ